MVPVLEAVGLSLPLALGIAAAPGAIIVLIILLLTPKAVRNACAFLMGWYMGLMLVGILILISPGLMDDRGEPSRLMGWIRLGMGLVFLIFSLLLFRRITRKENWHATPRWKERFDTTGFFQASATGFLFSTVNLKNSSMTLVGAALIARQGLTSAQELIALLLFCLIASIGVMSPFLIFFSFRRHAEIVFGKIKIWILQNQVLILLVILLVFGGISLYRGIIILQQP